MAMPKTVVRYRKEVVSSQIIGRLRGQLQLVIAGTLDISKVSSCEQLLPEKVSLKFEEVGDLDVCRDLTIDVYAHNFPERVENADDRANTIAVIVREIVGGEITMIVCVWLMEVGVSKD